MGAKSRRKKERLIKKSRLTITHNRHVEGSWLASHAVYEDRWAVVLMLIAVLTLSAICIWAGYNLLMNQGFNILYVAPAVFIVANFGFYLLHGVIWEKNILFNSTLQQLRIVYHIHQIKVLTVTIPVQHIRSFNYRSRKVLVPSAIPGRREMVALRYTTLFIVTPNFRYPVFTFSSNDSPSDEKDLQTLLNKTFTAVPFVQAISKHLTKDSETS